MNYIEFLKSKIEIATESGFEIEPSQLNKALKPHQKDAVAWALRGGCRALFESFGLGKTVQEIEFCYQAAKHCNGRALIVLPLGVKQEFTRDAVKLLGYEKPDYCRTMEEVEASGSMIVLTNYERVRDGDIRPDYFCATSLDEASVLRSFGSKTYQTFLDKFKNVPYKLVATATPSPNRYKELIHYAGYLEVMDTGQALTRFFQRDSTKANNLTLYPNMEDEFWLWVSSWALFITKPSDLNPNYSDEGYVLPPLEVRWHELPVHYGDKADKNGQVQMFTEAAEGLKNLFGEHELDLPGQDSLEVLHIAITALEEIQQYRAIDTVEECRKALERMKPKSPTYDGDGYAPDGTFVWDEWLCPNCGSRYEVDFDEYDHCPNCGQAILREEAEAALEKMKGE